MDFRSLTAGGSDRAHVLEDKWRSRLVDQHPYKAFWFLQHGYEPHVWQHLFHSATGDDGLLIPYRHLVAGRRGGKTLSAAWEVLYYATNPREFHLDAHGEETSEPLWIWCLAKDHKVGRPSLVTFQKVIRQAGLIKGTDYDYNKTEKVFTFFDVNGDETAVVEFRSADDPESLRGAGLDLLWIDEAAFIPNQDALNVILPALAEKFGLIITTTTPHGKNWFWELYFDGVALEDERQFRVQYTSIDNPYFPRAQWEYYMKYYHPVMFKQEFMAAFDALAGLSLSGDWLKYFVDGNPDIQTEDIGLPRYKDDLGNWRVNLDLHIGVDPAISLSDSADSFAIALVGVTQDRSQAYLLDYWVGKIPFPDQLDKIQEWFLRYRPQYIAIESVAYQVALAQMAARQEGMPPVVAIKSQTTRKNDRLMQLGPVFKIGKVRIRKTHREFIEQWVNFDYEVKNNSDDLLDAVEIALGSAGVLLAVKPLEADLSGARGSTLEEEAWLQILNSKHKTGPHDPDLGSEA